MDVPASSALPDRFRDAVPIGSGAQGQTYRAFDTKLDREVAVKVLHLGRVDDWKQFDLFERECAVLGSLDHTGIPRYFDHFSDQSAGTYVLVMELVQGRSLAQDVAEGRRRTEDQLFALTDGLLDVLQYLHELHPPVIHRDIKPGNVIQRFDGSPVLVDFGGVARPLGPRGASTMIGTFGYMAPEQLYGKASAASDLYALGATIAAVAAGLEGEDLPRRGHAIDLHSILRPGPLRDTVSAMLALEPEARPASAREARRRLHVRPSPPARLAPGSRSATLMDPSLRVGADVTALVNASHGGASRPNTVLALREHDERALAPITPRETLIAAGLVSAGTLLTAFTGTPLVILAVLAVLIGYFAIVRGRKR